MSMSHVWKIFQEKKKIAKHMQIKHKHILVPGQRYQDSIHLLQNPKVFKNVMVFNNHAKRSTPPYHLDVDNPLGKGSKKKRQIIHILWISVLPPLAFLGVASSGFCYFSWILAHREIWEWPVQDAIIFPVFCLLGGGQFGTGIFPEF